MSLSYYIITFLVVFLLLKLAKAVFTWFLVAIEDIIEDLLPIYEKRVIRFFLKVDFLVNKTRWEYLAAFLYVISL